MRAYSHDGDFVGLTNSTMCMFTREFDGPFNGLYAVRALNSSGFYWGSLPGVMDDFGNLVPVEG